MGTVDNTNASDFDELISSVRSSVLEQDEGLVETFDIYAQEARFSRAVFDEDLRMLPTGAAVLEVGAGMMLLSCQLVREGFRVTALEPFGEGFSHFTQLQKIIKKYAVNHAIEPEYLEYRAEDISVQESFDFAFSSNVMEHVDDIGMVLEKIYRSLKEGAVYRFICPNYAFPYEPHFNMPTLGSKSLTERVMRKRIEGNCKLPDPAGTWKSLNWITPRKVKIACRERIGIATRFDAGIFYKYLERAFNDPLFQQRRGRNLSEVLRIINTMGIFKLVRLMPVQFLPVMDCSIIKAAGSST